MPTVGEIPDAGHGPDPDKNRCAATNDKDGSRCKNAAVTGLSRCHQHIDGASSSSPSRESNPMNDAGVEQTTLAAAGRDPEPEPELPVWERQRRELLEGGA